MGNNREKFGIYIILLLYNYHLSVFHVIFPFLFLFIYRTLDSPDNQFTLTRKIYKRADPFPRIYMHNVYIV